MKEIAEHWLNAAQDDLRVMARIAPDESLTHMIAFHAQQCIEKSLKGVMEEYELGHIRIHNLARLFEIVRPNSACFPTASRRLRTHGNSTTWHKASTPT